MKKIINILIVAALAKTQVFALFGAGDIVSDPTSYTYYMKQIKAMNDQLESAFKQVEELNKINQLTEKANDLLFNTGEKIFNPQKRILGIVNDLQSSISRMQSLGERVKNMGTERFIKDYHNVNKPLNNEEFEKWQAEFEKLFSLKDDETYEQLEDNLQKAIKSGDYKQYERAVNMFNDYIKIRNIEREKLRYYSLLAPSKWYNEYYLSEEGKKRRDDRFKKIGKYTMQIDNEKDLMKQQQTTNQILLLIVETIDEQYNLQMQFFNAMSIAVLSEKDQEQTDIEIEELKRTKEELKNSSSAKLKTDDEKRKIRQKLFDDLEREAKRNKKSYDFFNQYNKF
jgi:hypothetical protein